MRIHGTLVAVLSLVLAGTPAFAQSFQGGLRGAVHDPGGAVIPGVEVSLINEATNATRNTISNETGEFVFASVSPGMYRLHVMMPGFKTFERAGINIGTQQFITLDVNLEVGATSEEISVVADAPLIETSTASNSSSLPNFLLNTLPNTSRNAYMTALTVPTVITAGDPHFSRLPKQYNMDVALHKAIPLTEKTRIAIRFEAINFTNTPKFTAPESRWANGSFGTVAAQASFPRLIQYMIRYEF